MSNQVPVVLTNAAQSFTDTQKAQGRANIDAAFFGIEMKSQAFCDLMNSNASASSYPATWSYSEGMFPYLYNWTQE